MERIVIVEPVEMTESGHIISVLEIDIAVRCNTYKRVFPLTGLDGTPAGLMYVAVMN